MEYFNAYFFPSILYVFPACQKKFVGHISFKFVHDMSLE